MSSTAIQVERLGKKYQIGVSKETSYSTLRETLSNTVNGFFKAKQSRDESKDFWALQDISFTVKKGEVIGIIGANGAGKSTLLKLLSRITEPSTGQITLYGRVASLLEVGTGFHPELTGRENIFLSGTLLGMSRKEIKQQFDAILAFSGVEKFVDTPVKRYSSGMRVRLGFAVAAHLQAEILLIDEVLAVGDAAFQEKCLGKVGEVASSGRTVFFVSHNMGSISALCEKSIYLNHGKLEYFDQTDLVIDHYLKGEQKKSSEVIPYNSPTSVLQVIQVILIDSKGKPTSQIKLGESFQIIIKVKALSHIEKCYPVLGIDCKKYGRIATAKGSDTNFFLALEPEETKHITVEYKENIFAAGHYQLFLAFRKGRGINFVALTNLLQFEVINIPFNSLYQNFSIEDRWGCVNLFPSFKTIDIERNN